MNFYYSKEDESILKVFSLSFYLIKSPDCSTWNFSKSFLLFLDMMETLLIIFDGKLQQTEETREFFFYFRNLVENSENKERKLGNSQQSS